MRHNSVKDVQKIRFWAKKIIFFKIEKKMLGPKRKYFQTLTDIISSEQLRKLEKIKPFGHSKAPKKKKL